MSEDLRVSCALALDLQAPATHESQSTALRPPRARGKAPSSTPRHWWMLVAAEDACSRVSAYHANCCHRTYAFLGEAAPRDAARECGIIAAGL
eukprot:gene15760-biopygen16253